MAIASIMHPALFVLIVLIIGMYFFISGKVPIPFTAAFICLSLYLAGIIDSKTVLKNFGSGNVMIVAGLGIVGDAMFRTGAAAQIGVILKKIAKSERVLVFWLVVFSGVISGFLSNNGCAALLISLTLGISISTNYRRCKLMYPIAVGVCFGGGITTVGSNSTLYLKEILEKQGGGQTMTFFELAPICLILIFVSAVFLSTIGFKLMPEEPNNELDPSYGHEKDYSNIPAWKRKTATAILIGTILVMCFEDQIGISVGIMAMIAATLCVMTGLLTEKEATRAVPLSAIIMYACMVPVSDAMNTSGASQILVDFMHSTLGANASPMFVILMIYLVAIPITNVMSNSATIIMLTPVVLAIAASIGMNPKSALMTLRMAGTIAIATPIGLPATTMAAEPGGYTFMDYVRPGLPLSIITIIITVVYMYVAYPVYL
ncbi:MAG: SLC13/DASS family transporter [Synergistaceae bacterium]|nr:SLC13/DASS family transporter [Synergistaceae bacterium]